jgi:hypothetical protein
MLAIAAAFLVAPAAQAERCTVAVISDTQNYVDASFPQPRGVDTVMQQMQYIVDTKAAKNTVFATHVGDIVQNGDGRFRTGTSPNFTYWDTQFEWQAMDTALFKLTAAGIPFGLGRGNHDFDNYSWYATGPGGTPGPGANRPLAGATSFQRYFGPNSRHFAGKPWYGAGPESNSFQKFECGTIKFINLSLEHEPRTATLQWAQTVLDANPGVPTMITTHEWIDPNFAGRITRSNDKASYFAGTSHSTPDKVWETFVYKNSQIFMTISGHDFTGTPGQAGVSNGQVRRVDKNKAGFDVHQLVSDYQGNTVGLSGVAGSDNGGGGWMRFMEFDTDTRQISVYTYSTLLNKYAGRNGENTFGTAPDFSEFVLPFPGQLNTVMTDDSAELKPRVRAVSK